MVKEHPARFDGSGDPFFLSESRKAISLDMLGNPILVEGLAYWRGLCRGRKFPSREDITPYGLKKLIRNVVLIRAIDGGADYEFRIVGDACVIAHGMSVKGMSLSELLNTKNKFASARKRLYDAVLRRGEPMAFGGMVVPDNRKGEVVHNTIIILPLGPNDQTVEYLLLFSVYAPNMTMGA